MQTSLLNLFGGERTSRHPCVIIMLNVLVGVLRALASFEGPCPPKSPSLHHPHRMQCAQALLLHNEPEQPQSRVGSTSVPTPTVQLRTRFCKGSLFVDDRLTWPFDAPPSWPPETSGSGDVGNHPISGCLLLASALHRLGHHTFWTHLSDICTDGTEWRTRRQEHREKQCQRLRLVCIPLQNIGKRTSGNVGP